MLDYFYLITYLLRYNMLLKLMNIWKFFDNNKNKLQSVKIQVFHQINLKYFKT
jgi:hypothetical protein